MRKIIIVFVAAIICFGVGIGVFAMEASSIQEEPVYLSGKQTTYTQTVADNVDKVSIENEYSGYQTISDDDEDEGTLHFTEVKEDSSMDPNTIEITYSDVFEIKNYTDTDWDDGREETEMDLYFYLKENTKTTNTSKTTNNFKKAMEKAASVWSKKKVKVNQVSGEDQQVSIRYGSNVARKLDIDYDD